MLVCFLRYSQMGFPCLTGRQNWTHLVIITFVNEPWPVMYRQYGKEQRYHFECSHWVNMQSKGDLLLLISMEHQILQSPFYSLLLWSCTSWANLYDNDVIKNAFKKWILCFIYLSSWSMNIFFFPPSAPLCVSAFLFFPTISFHSCNKCIRVPIYS